MRLVNITALTAAATLAAAVAMASPAQALGTPHNGVVELGELGLYYLSGSTGHMLDQGGPDANLANNVFPGTTINADNNTESYRNRSDANWFVFTGASYTGSRGCIPPGHVGDASTKFQNTISSVNYLNYLC